LKGVLDAGLPTQAPGGDGSSAPSHLGHKLDGSRVPFDSTAAHEPIGILGSLWARQKSLDTTMNKMIGMNIQGQTVGGSS